MVAVALEIPALVPTTASGMALRKAFVHAVWATRKPKPNRAMGPTSSQ